MKSLVNLVIALLMTQAAYAYEGFGICNHGKETLDNVICYGPTVLKETTVTGDVKVAGPLTAINVTAGSLTINGTCDLQNTKVKGAVEVIGNLNATGVEFQQSVTVQADDIYMSHTRIAGSMTVSALSKNPTITMECGTVIKGSLTFQGKAGVIQITDDSIVVGKITNGSMVFIKKICNSASS